MPDPSALITPENPWSLWVPLLLLTFIVFAALYFATLSAR